LVETGCLNLGMTSFVFTMTGCLFMKQFLNMRIDSICSYLDVFLV